MHTPARDPVRPNPLTECLIALAGTPDDSAWIDSQLITLVHLAADIGPVRHSSATIRHNEGFATVATTDDVAVAMDEKQYADHAGPCLEALGTEVPVPVPDILATTTWPAFRDHAVACAVRASLSVPLFAGRGSTVAALNLYGADPAAMAPLTAAVLHAHESHTMLTGGIAGRLDRAGTGLVAGIIGAFGIRSVIQQAVAVLVADTHRSPDAAYQVLRQRAAENGTPLLGTATAILAEQDW
jgi:hypothetical protein